jgi:hypothetical protein
MACARALSSILTVQTTSITATHTPSSIDLELKGTRQICSSVHARALTWKAFIIEFSMRNTIACAISSGSVNRRGNMELASSSSWKYFFRPPLSMIGEITSAGATELTRIPHGARKSAAALVIPKTQAASVSIVAEHGARILTLGGTVRQATGGGIVCHYRSQVDDATPLLFYSIVEDVKRWILRIDRLGHYGIYAECPESVDFEYGGEILLNER